MKLPNNFYYFSYFIVLPKRFERLTHNLEGCCSIQLSYGSIFLIKELSQHKYNKKFWNFQIIFIIFCIFCAYSWIRTNALPYPYGRFLCLSGLTDSISNISRHYFESSIVSCSVYASNLYRQIIVGFRGALTPRSSDYEFASFATMLWTRLSKNFQTLTIQI